MSGFTIVQISDFHNETFGENNKKIIEKIEDCKPDMIAITGDFIDCRHPNVDIAMEFITQAVDIAPVYYVPGNHERWVTEKYQELCHRMKEMGVHLMMNKAEEIIYEGERILCLGIEDPDFYNVVDDNAQKEKVKSRIENLEYSAKDFTVLLSHRPELFKIYVDENMDVVLTGHAHGGQFRLPLIGGVAAPNQGFFPQYDAGMFVGNDTHMIVSRGIGNSIIPLRFNNPPEIVVVKLTAK
jgi:predicted MPP superfamily phosphohydrolase